MDAHDIAPELRTDVFMYPQEIALDDDAAISDLLKTCAHIKAQCALAQGQEVSDPSEPREAFTFVVIDVFGSSMAGSETTDETARAWVRNINRIMREVGCAVLTVAHTPWSDDSRARMHTHFWGSFDSRMKANGDKQNLTTVLTIDRHKDADSEGEWGFRMEKVDAPIGGATLVPRLLDKASIGQQTRISGKPAVALGILSKAVTENGKIIAGPGYPSFPVVAVGTWRMMCDRRGMTYSDNPEAARKAFNRARRKLIDMGLVAEFNGHVWINNDDG